MEAKDGTLYKVILYTYNERGDLISEEHVRMEEPETQLQVYTNIEAWGSFSHEEVNQMLAEGYFVLKDGIYAKNVLMARFKQEVEEEVTT